MIVISILHWVSALIVIIEALNKLERYDPFQKMKSVKQMLIFWMTSAAWVALAVGSAGALVMPFLSIKPKLTADAFVLIAFAALLVRARLYQLYNQRAENDHA